VLFFGGDTDTNCAIVGGVIGAWLGLSLLPAASVAKVVECDITRGNQSKRPKFLQTKSVGLVEMVEAIVDKRPR